MDRAQEIELMADLALKLNAETDKSSALQHLIDLVKNVQHICFILVTEICEAMNKEKDKDVLDFMNSQYIGVLVTSIETIRHIIDGNIDNNEKLHSFMSKTLERFNVALDFEKTTRH